ncbi:hypothetical protein CKO31_20585 [Thiohalocapsa halophila]|uniref:PAS domain-containing protein n=1 Tax=Thiohalocapsa halophila TaxID=69359 RepID=A0ABS1CMN5_9GAMM|nr:hypothetical protein [Thiohalocapsa halophila]MBK1633104.1 hypothetical protein [Thiohalocapsa halophila]
MHHQDRDSREFVHRIDADDRICFVNDSWLAFATENDWPDGAPAVLGSPLMSYIADAKTRHIYRLLIDRVRATGHPLQFRYRCDSPDLRRFMEMRMSSKAEGEVELRSRVLRLEGRDPIPVLDTTQPRHSGNPLQICSWCKAIYAQATWLNLEEAMHTLDVLSDAVLPELTHGICPDCSDRMLRVGGAQ